MAQYVIEFGAEQLEFVAAAIKFIVAAPYRVFVGAAGSEMSYSETARTFDEVSSDLTNGAAASAIIRTSDPRVRYALITSPKIHVPALALWVGTIEIGADEWAFVWEALLEQPGLRFVCVGFEEGLDLADDQLSPETFPWDAAELLAGAVRRDGDGDWSLRAYPPR